MSASPGPREVPSDSTTTPNHKADTGRAPRATPGHRDQQPTDALRRSRTSGTWIAVLALVVLLALLAVFILQNTQPTEVSYFGWTGEAPLAAMLIIATAAGLLIAGVVGSLRIWQLKRRVRAHTR